MLQLIQLLFGLLLLLLTTTAYIPLFDVEKDHVYVLQPYYFSKQYNDNQVPNLLVNKFYPPVLTTTSSGKTAHKYNKGKKLQSNHKISAILVNFHSSSCGHCQKHAGSWKALAYALNTVKSSTAAWIIVSALDCDQYRDTCTLFSVNDTPDLKLFDGIDGKLVRNFTIPENFDDALDIIEEKFKIHVAFSHRQRARKLIHNNVFENLARPISNLQPRTRVISDMETAIRFGLETGVFLGRNELDGDALQALIHWLDLLSKTFPGEISRWKLDWLKRQIQSRTTTTNSNQLTSHLFDELLVGWDFGRGGTWNHCSDELGFPCGLWMLFHTISVSPFLDLVPDNKFGHHLLQHKLPSPAATIHGFIYHFFSCSECRDNFLAKNPTPPSSNDEEVDFPLWLWREHNSVNTRLGHPKFPSLEACTLCYDSHYEFDEVVVRRFLISAYGTFEPNTEPRIHGGYVSLVLSHSNNQDDDDGDDGGGMVGGKKSHLLTNLHHRIKNHWSSTSSSITPVVDGGDKNNIVNENIDDSVLSSILFFSIEFLQLGCLIGFFVYCFCYRCVCLRWRKNNNNNNMVERKRLKV
jgi:hypothetical protein